MSEKKMAKVFHADLYGKREEKYDFLGKEKLSCISWKELDLREPNRFFIDKNYDNSIEYNEFIPLNEIILIYGSGTKFRKDSLLVKPHHSKESVLTMIKDINSLTVVEILNKYNFSETEDWKIDEQRIFFKNIKENEIRLVHYRPFDYRFTYYPMDKIASIIPRGDSRKNLMVNFLKTENVGLVVCRQQSSFDFQHIFITNLITDLNSISIQTKEQSYIFPIFIYEETVSSSLIQYQNRKPNLNYRFISQIAENHTLTFTNEKEETPGTFAPIDLLDYIYAILHSPTYRQKYKEFLKIDFPRIPYPKDQGTFWKFVKLGGELRRIHLLEAPIVEQFITSYPVSGNNEVGKVRYQDGKVLINDTQYFDLVPQVAWEFYIGGYQPAQKWLKDRKGRQLMFEDVRHYQKIIVALTETDRIMKEIDKVKFE